MALTRAQLLTGNSSQGVVLAGQTQGVRQGVGVIIAADGTISFDSVTATGVLKTNNPTAYNAYVWPTTLGAVGQQLQLGAGGALSWEDPDQIPWTAKGQLIAGTGVGTSTLLNVGVDGSILIADSTQASGLGYTTNFVATTGATSAANIPAGPVGSRPGSPIQGQLRFSTTSGEMEFWDGTSWQTIAGSATGLFVDKTANNGSAVIPAGTQAQRDSSPGAGYFRYDSTLNAMEFYDGTIWQVVVASASGNIFATLAQAQVGTIATLAATPETAVPKDASGMTGSAYLPAGTTAQRPTASNYTGQFRYNTTIPQLEYSDGTTWLPVSGASISPASLAQAQAGTLTTVYSSPQTAVPKDASGMTGSAYLPAGTTAQRPTASNYTGQFRYNTTIPQLEYSDGAAWQPVSGASLLPASLAEAQAGTITTKYSSPETAVPKDASGMTGSAYLPAGTTAQRPTASNYTGQFRYNTTIPQLEYSDGAAWLGLGGLAAATLVQAQAGTLTTVATTPETAVPKDASGMTGSAYIPAGTTAQRPTASNYTGQFRYNTTIPQLEYSDGAAWLGLGGLAAATLVQAQAGTLTTVAATPQTAVPKDASGMVGAAILPGGTQVQRPGTPAAGMIRYNTNTYGSDTVYEAYDPVIPGWRPIQYGVSLGVLPNYTATNGATLPASGTYENITIPAGVTVYVDGLSSLRARSSIVVNGTLVGTGRGYVGGQGGATFQVGGPSDYLATAGSPGAGAGRGQGDGGLANAGIAYGFNLLLGSSGGSGAITTFGASGLASAAGAIGGAGGASITFVCDGTITVGASAIISMNGTTPGAPPVLNNAQVGGGGGGSGGLILLQAAQSLTLGAAVLDVSGGAGSSGAATGVSITGWLGGGGGGGGYVVLSSPNLTNSASINLNGGSAGPIAGVPEYANGGGGGGFGGAGGAGGQNLGGGPYIAPTAGANGQILTNAYI